MKNLTKISYVIPAYNCASTIEESIKSIITRNFEDGDEIIVINDCSTDNTLQILQSISKVHPIKLITNKINVGCPASRNIGISKSKNELIFNLDSDNMLVPKSRELLVRTLRETNADIVMFEKVIFFNKNLKNKTHEWIYPFSTFTLEDLFASNYNSAATSCYLYKKGCITKFGKYNENYGKGLHESWLFILDCLSKGASIYIAKNSSYMHRYGHNSLYTRESKSNILEYTISDFILNRYAKIFSTITTKYMITNKKWLSDLNTHPIKLENKHIGRAGLIKKYHLVKYNDFFYRIIKSLYQNITRQINNIVLLRVFISFTYKLLSQIYYQIYGYIYFTHSYINYLKADKSKRFSKNISDFYPCIYDKTIQTEYDKHYTYFPAWAFRVLLKFNPPVHIDISSSLVFCSMVSACIPVEFYDFRPAKIELSGLESKFADITKLDFKSNTITSLSSMHVLEHIGLGRYGDAIDPDGDIKAANELTRVLSKGGQLLVVVPVGKERIQFNAHRIYSYESIVSLFKKLRLVESYLIPDGSGQSPMYNASANIFNNQNYACGCFVFKKE